MPQMTETIEGVATPDVCPPHQWKEQSRETPQETKDKNQANSDKLAKSPSKAEQKRGYDHENTAIDKNMNTMPIEATSVIYECDLCHDKQEVDILGANNQVAEAKSRKAKKVKDKRKQAKNYKDIQRQLNAEKGTSHKPLAKTDSSLPDAADAKEIYEGRGFDVEPI
jgi:hypothetical protein